MKTIQVQLAISVDEDAAKTLAELLAPAVRQMLGIVDAESEEKRMSRLRSSRNAIYGGEKPPEDQGLLIDSKEAARLLNVSQRTLWRMHTTGEMPPPIRIGRAVRWSIDVLTRWVSAGCPLDSKWRS